MVRALSSLGLACLLVAQTGCELVAGIDDRWLAPSATSSGGAGGGAGAGGAGGTIPGGGSGGVAGGGGAPVVVAAVENLEGGEGNLLACPLGAGEAPAGCEMIGPAGMPEQPMAVGWIPPDLIVVGARGQVVGYSLSDHMIVWTDTVDEDLPADVFPLTTSGEDGAVVAAAYRGLGIDDVRHIYAYSRGGARLEAWTLNDGVFPLGLGWTGMTQRPGDTSHFYALRPGAFALAEVDPLAADVVDDGMTTSYFLHTIHALHDGVRLRAAWVGGDADTDIHLLTEGGAVSGPIGCSFADEPCAFEHAVPDPTSATNYVGLCKHSGSVVLQIVRLEVGSTAATACEVLFDGQTLGTSRRLSRLAVIP